LLQLLLKVKEDNFILKKEMADVTIECNKILRMPADKNLNINDSNDSKKALDTPKENEINKNGK
jgi:hypothetical protein